MAAGPRAHRPGRLLAAAGARTARRPRPLPPRAGLRGSARARQDNRHCGYPVGHRLLRINESIKETLSSVITAEGLKDPRVGFVTVTGVKTSADQRHAKVYVSVLGKQAEREATMKALDKSLSLIHISEPTRLGMISYAVFCLKKK